MNDKPDRKAVAEQAWNAPGWAKAAEQYASERPKSTAVTGGSWTETCRLADRKAARNHERPEVLRARRLLADDGVSLDRAWHEFNNARTPQTTIEAVMYCVRERGIAALEEPANVERLDRCDEAAMDEINQRIAKLNKEIS